MNNLFAECRLLLDAPGLGPWNMAVDETLLEGAADRGEMSLRFYRWSKPTLSLGYFQKAEDRRLHATSSECTLVRRSSGGGAILHDGELTYSIAVPEGNPFASSHLTLYRAMHQALIQALSHWQIDATLWESTAKESIQTQPFLCFQRRSVGDLLLGKHKIAGSAQRRLRGAVLQHGSLLLDRSRFAPELPGVVQLSDCEGSMRVGFEEIQTAWLDAIASQCLLSFTPGRLSPAEKGRAEGLVQEKYATSDWTVERKRTAHLS